MPQQMRGGACVFIFIGALIKTLFSLDRYECHHWLFIKDSNKYYLFQQAPVRRQPQLKFATLLLCNCGVYSGQKFFRVKYLSEVVDKTIGLTAPAA
ncbi:hypothetical protein [Dulcicalothrix desertica]|uniref:hypothetical protein n=1 Tax=Dulcicalothrix desertica TaxID=32056 RepID=UPI0011D12E5D|nr:hypothetical protein [Dulcicalothrix desertica]